MTSMTTTTTAMTTRPLFQRRRHKITKKIEMPSLLLCDNESNITEQIFDPVRHQAGTNDHAPNFDVNHLKCSSRIFFHISLFSWRCAAETSSFFLLSAILRDTWSSCSTFEMMRNQEDCFSAFNLPLGSGETERRIENASGLTSFRGLIRAERAGDHD